MSFVKSKNSLYRVIAIFLVVAFTFQQVSYAIPTCDTISTGYIDRENHKPHPVEVTEAEVALSFLHEEDMARDIGGYLRSENVHLPMDQLGQVFGDIMTTLAQVCMLDITPDEAWDEIHSIHPDIEESEARKWIDLAATFKEEGHFSGGAQLNWDEWHYVDVDIVENNEVDGMLARYDRRTRTWDVFGAGLPAGGLGANVSAGSQTPVEDLQGILGQITAAKKGGIAKTADAVCNRYYTWNLRLEQVLIGLRIDPGDAAKLKRCISRKEDLVFQAILAVSPDERGRGNYGTRTRAVAERKIQEYCSDLSLVASIALLHSLRAELPSRDGASRKAIEPNFASWDNRLRTALEELGLMDETIRREIPNTSSDSALAAAITGTLKRRESEPQILGRYVGRMMKFIEHGLRQGELRVQERTSGYLTRTQIKLAGQEVAGIIGGAGDPSSGDVHAALEKVLPEVNPRATRVIQVLGQLEDPILAALDSSDAASLSTSQVGSAVAAVGQVRPEEGEFLVAFLAQEKLQDTLKEVDVAVGNRGALAGRHRTPGGVNEIIGQGLQQKATIEWLRDRKLIARKRARQLIDDLEAGKRITLRHTDMVDHPRDGFEGKKLKVVYVPIDNFGLDDNNDPITGHPGLREGILWIAVGENGSRLETDPDGVEMDVMHEQGEYNATAEYASSNQWDIARIADWRDGKGSGGVANLGGFSKRKEIFDGFHVKAWEWVADECGRLNRKIELARESGRQAAADRKRMRRPAGSSPKAKAKHDYVRMVELAREYARAEIPALTKEYPDETDLAQTATTPGTPYEHHQRVPLYDWHKEKGVANAMTEFGFHDMPTLFRANKYVLETGEMVVAGVTDPEDEEFDKAHTVLEGEAAEQMAVRNHVGVFDISHMGFFEVSGEGAEAFLDRVATRHVAKIGKGKIRYSFICDDNGKAIDEALIYNLGDNRYMVVVNAGHQEAIQSQFDAQIVEQGMQGKVEIAHVNDKSHGANKQAALSIQGPKALEVFESFNPEVEIPLSEMKYFTVQDAILTIGGRKVKVSLSRSGYAGDRGFEILLPEGECEHVWQTLVDSGVMPCGLNSRDILRLEAGLGLMGQELEGDPNGDIAPISPFESGAAFAVDFDKGDFVGREALLQRRAEAHREVVNLALIGQDVEDGKPHEMNFNLKGGLPRHQNESAGIKESSVIKVKIDGEWVEKGKITSDMVRSNQWRKGGFKEGFDKGIGLAMACVEKEFARPGTEVLIETTRGKRTVKYRAVIMPRNFSDRALDRFSREHMRDYIPITDTDRAAMMEKIGIQSMDELFEPVPQAARFAGTLDLPPAMNRMEAFMHMFDLSRQNVPATAVPSFLGGGIYNKRVPAFIDALSLETGFSSAYTPYQAEVMQGELEDMFLFQSEVCNYTGMDAANASPYDGGSALAEAALMAARYTSNATKKKRKRIVIAGSLNPKYKEVLRTYIKNATLRLGKGASAEEFTLDDLVEVAVDPETGLIDMDDLKAKVNEDTACVIVQQPNFLGCLEEQLQEVADVTHESGAVFAVNTNLSSLSKIQPPAEYGADIVVAEAQDMGNHMNFGGPGLGVLALKWDKKADKMGRRSLIGEMPGRVVGRTVDAGGNPRFDLTFDTREQHIARNNATSNICTNEALLALRTAFYMLWMASDGSLAKSSQHSHDMAIDAMYRIAEIPGFAPLFSGNVFNEFTLASAMPIDKLNEKLLEKGLIGGLDVSEAVGQDGNFTLLAFTDLTTPGHVDKLVEALKEISREEGLKDDGLKAAELPAREKLAQMPNPRTDLDEAIPPVDREQIREYAFYLLSRNYGIESGMQLSELLSAVIPLGSCTVKYNPFINETVAAFEGFLAMHPDQPAKTNQGILRIMYELERDLCEISGFNRVTLQPAAGAHGEFAGLQIMRKYHDDNGDQKRKIILVPDSSHGTNPASARMAGFEVKVIKTVPGGSGLVDQEALDEAIAKYGDRIAGMMVTNPNTLGLFESDIMEVCKKVEKAGGLMYLDGANMNAWLGIGKPADWGFHIMQANLHKTFSTPHGGGGPGSGPVGVVEKLAKYLPTPTVEYSKADGYYLKDVPDSIGKIHANFGNIGVAIKAYTYIRTLGPEGLRRVAEIAVLNANYMAKLVEDHYYMPFGEGVKRQHEFVIRPTQEMIDKVAEATGNTETVETVAQHIVKRLHDYGVHPPTFAFPLIVHGALMIEPTETASKAWMDNYCRVLNEIAEDILSGDPQRIARVVNAPDGSKTKGIRRVSKVQAGKDLILRDTNIAGIVHPVQVTISVPSGEGSMTVDVLCRYGEHKGFSRSFEVASGDSLQDRMQAELAQLGPALAGAATERALVIAAVTGPGQKRTGIVASSAGSLVGLHRGEDSVNDNIAIAIYNNLGQLEDQGRVDKGYAGRFRRWWNGEGEYTDNGRRPGDDVPEELWFPIQKLAGGQYINTHDGERIPVVGLPVDNFGMTEGKKSKSVTAHIGLSPKGKKQGVRKGPVVWLALGADGSARGEPEKGVDKIHEEAEILVLSSPLKVGEMMNEAAETLKGRGLREVSREEKLRLLTRLIYSRLTGPEGTTQEVGLSQMALWRDETSDIAQVFFHIAHREAWKLIASDFQQEVIDIGRRRGELLAKADVGDPDQPERPPSYFTEAAAALDEPYNDSIFVASRAKLAARAAEDIPDPVEVAAGTGIALASQGAPKRALLVEPQAGFSFPIQTRLEDGGFAVEVVTSAEAALPQLTLGPKPDLVVVNLDTEEGQNAGEAVLRGARNHGVPAILTTERQDVIRSETEQARLLRQVGADRILDLTGGSFLNELRVASEELTTTSRFISSEGHPLRLIPTQASANSCFTAVSESVEADGAKLLLVADTRIGHLGRYGRALIQEMIAKAREEGFKGKIEVLMHEDSGTIAHRIDEFIKENPGNKNAIVRGIVWNQKTEPYAEIEAERGRVSLVAVDDSRFESNMNEDNLRYFPITPLIEASFTGQLGEVPHMTATPGAPDSVITSIVTVDIPPAERVNIELLDELLEEEAGFLKNA